MRGGGEVWIRGLGGSCEANHLCGHRLERAKKLPGDGD